MSFTTIDFSVADHVAHIRLNRPDKLNAMSLAFWQDMVDAFAEIETRGDVRVAVISSTGRHFTAGLDLNLFGAIAGERGKSDRAREAEQLRRTVLEMQESFNVIERSRVPVLVAIQGGCIGGGVDLASACCSRYCTEDAYFRIQEINIGIVADVGTLQRLPHLMPAGVVRELAYTGRKMDAAEALRLGLVNQIYGSHEAMLAGVMAMAREIAAKSPLAVTGTKVMLNYTRDHSVADGLDYVATWQAGMLITDDVVEQMRANQEKRPAKFADLLPDKGYVRRRR